VNVGNATVEVEETSMVGVPVNIVGVGVAVGEAVFVPVGLGLGDWFVTCGVLVSTGSSISSIFSGVGVTVGVVNPESSAAFGFVGVGTAPL
jgi:hypothetical protein